MNQNKVRKLVLTGVMTALVFVATIAIRVPVPMTQGYIHVGDSMIFIAVLLLGWRHGAFAAGVGSALADLLAGYAHWIIPTLIIKSIMAILMGLAISTTKKSKGSQMAFISIVALAWAMFNYFIKNIITKEVMANPQAYVGQIDGAETMEALTALVDKVQGQLINASLIIPIALILFGLLLNRRKKLNMVASQIIGMVVAGFWMVMAYYIAAGIMYGSYIVAAFSIPWNIVQFVGGFFLAQVIIIGLKKSKPDLFQQF